MTFLKDLLPTIILTVFHHCFTLYLRIFHLHHVDHLYGENRAQLRVKLAIIRRMLADLTYGQKNRYDLDLTAPPLVRYLYHQCCKRIATS